MKGLDAVWTLGRFVNDTKGATSVEYALVVLLLAVATIAGLQVAGASLIRMFGVPTSGFNSIN